MPRANPLLPALNAGEFGPRMAARVDFNKYSSAGETVENLLILPQGGLMRRPGTRYVAEIKDSNAKPRLLRFEFSTTQAYANELGNNYFRFFKDQGQIVVADTDAAITNGAFTGNITGWDDRSTGAAAISHDATNGRLNLDGNGTDIAWAEQDVTTTDTGQSHVLRFRVLGVAGDTIELRIGTSSTGNEMVDDVEFKVGYHAYAFTPSASPFYVQFRNTRNKTVQIDNVSLIDNAALELQTPYGTSDLAALKTAQTADVMYVAQPSYPIHKLARSSHTSWSLEEVDWQDGPYLDENTTATTLQASATTGLGITITASATTGINDGQGFLSTDVGRLVRIQHGTNEHGYAVITAITDTTHVTADVKRDFNAATTSTKWSLGSWSGTTGHPSALTFFEQRFAAANNSSQPQTLWFSQSADIENMRPDSYDTSVTVEDDDALNYTIAADQVNAIRWMSPGQQLILGSAGGEWVVKSDGPVITPTDIDIKRQTTHGSADISPVRVDHAILFLQRDKRTLSELAYSFEVDAFKAPDMTLLAHHVTKPGVDEIAYQENPDRVVWCLRNDGVLAALTYLREQDIVGWSRMILGGSFGAGNAVVESVVTIPGNSTTDSEDRDEVWVVVKRTIDGATKRYVEFLEEIFEGPVRHDYASDAAWEAQVLLDQMDAYYCDSLLTLDSPVTITGATQADPVVITATAHGFSDGDYVRIDGVVGMTELNANTYKVANKTANTFELTDQEDDSDIDGTGFAAYGSGGEAREKVTTISGLDHLEGETVKVLADGAIHPDCTVASGSITLDYRTSKAQAGLGYTHTFQTLKATAGAAAGTAVSKIKRYHNVALLLLDTATFNIGPALDNLKTVEFREVGDSMDTAVPLFTGEKYEEFEGDYERDPRIYIRGDAPAPFVLLGIAPELKVNEKV